VSPQEQDRCFDRVQVVYRYALRVLLVAVVLGLALTVGIVAGAASADVENPFSTRAASSAQIHFVPLDPRAKRLLAEVVPSLRRWFHGPYEITAIPVPGASWVNTTRQQLNSRRIMSDLLARFRKAQGDRPAFVIPVTTYSLYDPDFPQYSFVFGDRGLVPQVQAMAIVSSADMRFGHPEREQPRFTKMLLRYIGEILCNLPRNSNHASVLYTPLLSDGDLDRMVATLPSRC
jgi:hypothetical protein